MANTPLTDEDLEAERRLAKHKRSEKLDNYTTYIMIVGMWFVSLIAGIAAIYLVYLYCYKIYYSPDVLSTIESIASHVVVAVGSYMAAFIKKHHGD
jgi:hypothetical protein